MSLTPELIQRGVAKLRELGVTGRICADLGNGHIEQIAGAVPACQFCAGVGTVVAQPGSVSMCCPFCKGGQV